MRRTLGQIVGMYYPEKKFRVSFEFSCAITSYVLTRRRGVNKLTFRTQPKLPIVSVFCHYSILHLRDLQCFFETLTLRYITHNGENFAFATYNNPRFEKVLNPCTGQHVLENLIFPGFEGLIH